MNSAEIARLARVSRTTVSRVLNGHPNVSEETRRRVEAVIAEQNYFPDAAARNLVGKPNKILGLFIIDFGAASNEYTIASSQFFYDYIAYSADIMNRCGYNLLTKVVYQDSLSDIDRLFQSRSIAGGIVMGDHLDQQILARFAARGYKLVLYNQVRHSLSPSVLAVNYDNFKSGYMAGQELVRQGHRRIVQVTGEADKLSVQERLDGFEKALTEAGVPFDRTRDLEYGEFNRRSGGYKAARRLLERRMDDLPTAVCAASATVLLGTFQAIRDLGFRVPEDISLIGIDDADAAIYTSPPLSVVSRSCAEIARLTIERLIELVEQEPAEARDYMISDVALALRGSIRPCGEAES